MAEVYKIVKGMGCGGFMNPPGDPAHTWSIESYSSNRSNARNTGVYALDSDAEWLPPGIRARASKMLADAERRESEMWVRSVYGYFRSMWTVDGQMWSNVTDLKNRRPEDAPDHWHAATVYVRKWFPGHEPRTDLIADPGKGYGSYPCDRCGKRVQYESRVDALATVDSSTWTYGVECADGGQHAVS